MALSPEEPRTAGNQGLSPIISPVTRERHFGRNKRWSLISFTGIQRDFCQGACLIRKKYIFQSILIQSQESVLWFILTLFFFFLPFYMVCLHSMFMFSFQYMPVAKLIISEVINLSIRSIDKLPEVSNKDA